MQDSHCPEISRRELLARSGLGLGSVFLASILRDQGYFAAAAASDSVSQPVADLTAKKPHFAPKAKAVIQLVQNGGPSQMDLFELKPELQKRNGQVLTDAVEKYQLGSEAQKLFGSPFAFHKRGECGMELSEVIPHLGSVVDELCLVRSMYSEHANHTEALVLLQTGKIFPGRPVLGSWVSYGLGTENQNLPAYIVLRDPAGYNTSGTLTWANGWLPALYRGTEFNTVGSPVLNLRSTKKSPEGVQQDNLEFLQKLNDEHRARFPQESTLEARVRNYELAARMQMQSGEVLDLSQETEATKKMYGLDNPVKAGYGTRCLMARRLIESGVRFVQIHPPVGQPWDTHSNTKSGLETICGQTDQPSAALIKDLKSRGLLDSTIVLWSGEFGRLPVAQGGDGRDHNRNAFSLLLAGGGFKAGHVHGATDDLGYKAAIDRVGVPDLHATILNQLGLDQNKLIYRHHGRPETPTDAVVTKARVVTELLNA